MTIILADAATVKVRPHANSGSSAATKNFDPSICAAPEDNRRIIDAAIAVLAQGELLLAIITPEAFARKNAIAFNASIGGHYRHCLDHFTCVMDGMGAAEINYDHRERNLEVETQPEVAFAATRQLKRRLEDLTAESLNSAVVAACEVSYEHGDSPRAHSTRGRELVYAIAHAIHHYALISVMARMMEIKLPEHFGVAPSTVTHQASLKTRLQE